MKKSMLLLALVVIVGFVACAPGDEGGEVTQFIVGNGTEPESLDPHLVSGVPEHRILMGIFEGLVVPDPETASAIPGVAESWEISDDNTVYTFTLREGAVWSDGTPITAQQFVDSWIRILHPDTASQYAWFPSLFIRGAEEFNAGEVDASAVAVRALDDRTFQFETVGPAPYTLDALSHYSFAVVPLHAIEEHGSEWTLPENFVGNGPFVLTEWSPQERIVVEPNPNYWNAEIVELDSVTFLPVEEDSTMYSMFVNEEMSWATNLPTGQIAEARLRDDFFASPQLGTYYYVFNNERPPLDDARVRQALSLAINRQLLVETVTRGGQVPAFTMVPEMTGYPGIDGLGEDIARAQQLLADAGFPDGEGFPELTVLYNTNEAHKSIGEFIQQQWLDNLGINVTLENQEWGTYLNTRREGNFDIARAGWLGDYQDPNTFLDLFVTGNALNGGRYSNIEFDRLVSQAARMAPGSERFDTLAAAERIFVEEDQGVMPIYYYVNLNLIDTANDWAGWYDNIMDWHPVGNVAGY